jgi:hypothetical protein
MNLAGKLMCRIGCHRPASAARWNQGYGFTRCGRCGVDLVRSLLGDWHVPERHRVVWSRLETAPVPVTMSKPIIEPRHEPEAPAAAVRLGSLSLKVDNPAMVPSMKAETSAPRSPFDFGDFDELPLP